MNARFNLVDEPWLPCVRMDDQPVALGLYDALAQAHTLRELQGETPLGTVALHRLLLAILHRNFGPANHRAWAQLWRAGCWDAAALRVYFDRWHDRLDLFDPERPFYQTANPPGQPESLNRLSLPHAYNSTLFEHAMADRTLVVPAARAAEWLVTLQASGIGMGPPFNPYPAGPLVNTLLVLVQGRTLFETLIFNLVEYHDERPIPAPQGRADRPIWEYDQNPFPPEPKTFYWPGYLEYLTWQCRAIRLLPAEQNGQVYVRECYLSQGARWNNQEIEDPMKVYTLAKKAEVGMLPLRLREDRAMWRDADALFRLRDANVRPPLAFSWLAGHVERGCLDLSQTYDYAVLGLSNDNARLDFFRHERMPLPLAYLADETLGEKLREALQAAENIGLALRDAGRDLARWMVSPTDKTRAHKDDVRLVFERLGIERLYWPRLDVPFRRFVEELPHDRRAALERWLDTLRGAARAAFEAAAENAGDPLRSLKAATLARGTLEWLMARAVEPKS